MGINGISVFDSYGLYEINQLINFLSSIGIQEERSVFCKTCFF